MIIRFPFVWDFIVKLFMCVSHEEKEKDDYFII